MLKRRPTPHAPRRGLSLVELMIGVTVGLIVVAGGLALMARNLGNARGLLTEAHLNQDMRAAMDLITRDLRRAGYWGNAVQGTLAVGTGSATARNPYAGVSNGEGDLAYRFSRDGLENDQLDDNENFGFRVADGKLQMQTASGVWQDLTDTGSMTIVPYGLAIVANQTVLPLGHLCPRACTAGMPNCPSTTVRSFTVTLTALSARDVTLMRTMRSTVRVRNDQLAGLCPA